MYLDSLGLAPGDSYTSADEAAIQAIRDINPRSIHEDIEYAGRIFQQRNGKYSYTAPKRGERTTSNPGFCPEGTINKGMYHTHARNNPGFINDDFSTRDKHKADNERVPSYLGTPSKQIKKYVPYYDPRYDGTVTIIGTTK